MIQPTVDPPSERENQIRKAFLRLTPEEEALLCQLEPLMGTHADRLVEQFYRHLLQFEEPRRLLSEEVVAHRLKDLQKNYLKTLVQGKYDEAYMQERFRIGQVHERIKLAPQWYLGGYGYYLSLLIPLILDRFQSQPFQLPSILSAFIKVVSLDMELAMEAYIKHSSLKLELANQELSKLIQTLHQGLDAQTTQLKDSEERFRSLFQNVSIPLFTYDRQGKILLWNKALEELPGWREDNLMKKTLFEIIAKEDEIQRIQEIIETVFKGRGLTDIDWEVKTEADQARYLSISTFPVRNTSGAVVFGIAIVMDITEKKQLEQALVYTEKMAALGTLASGLAHEIGTPMNVILGRAESLLKHTREEKTAKGLKIIIDQIDGMTRLIHHLLTFARRKPIEKKPVQINQIIEKGIEIVEQQTRARGISVVADLDPHLPTLWGDGDQLLQVLVNLFMNAIDAIHQGGTIEIRTRLIRLERRGETRPESSSHQNRMIQILFKDTGSGIDPAHLDKIFDPFFTTKPVGKGTGLGLAVAHGIIRDHGGQIEVASMVSQGTTFSIRLPIG